jgi:hypothetical protein
LYNSNFTACRLHESKPREKSQRHTQNFLLLEMESINNLMNRVRKVPITDPWQEIPQPVPLVKVVAQPIVPGSSSVRYVATGITSEAEQILAQLPAPLYIVAFAGFGRSGKSYTASLLRYHITGNKDYKVFINLK